MKRNQTGGLEWAGSSVTSDLPGMYIKEGSGVAVFFTAAADLLPDKLNDEFRKVAKAVYCNAIINLKRDLLDESDDGFADYSGTAVKADVIPR